MHAGGREAAPEVRLVMYAVAKPAGAHSSPPRRNELPELPRVRVPYARTEAKLGVERRARVSNAAG